MPDRLVVAHIDLAAYRHNLSVLRSKIPTETKLMAVLKANAYGHGAIGMAQVAQDVGADYIGVVCLGEARQLREAKITLPILILNYIDPVGAVEATHLGCEITVMDAEVIKSIGESGENARLHLKVDTGMHRAGCDPTQALSLIRLIRSFPNLELVGVFTHFANSDDVDLSFAQTQLATFSRVIAELKEQKIHIPLIHAANSGATLSLPESHFDMVRPGIASYGLCPFSESHPQYIEFQQHFRPVLSLQTQIVHIAEITTGDSVGYGRTFIAKHPMKIALLPVGYGDGIRRAPNNWKEVLVGGKRAPILGRVSMDQTTIDVTHLADVSVHDEVVLIGKQGEEELTAEEIAKNIGTINYEVVTGLTSRVARIYGGNV